MSGLGVDRSLTDELTALERRRTTLEQLMAVARHLRTLEQLLQKIMLLSDPTGKMPPQAITFYERLSLRTQALPDDEVQGRLRALEAKLKRYARDLSENVAGREDALSGEEFAEAAERIERLRRYGQTAVGLRVMLQKRGCPSRPLKIAISRKALEQRIAGVRQREQRYREKIVGEMRAILDDLGRILAAEGASDAMHESLSVIEAELQSDLEHVLAGGNIQDLPSRYESIEMAGEWISTEETVEVSAPADQAEPQEPEATAEPRPANAPPLMPVSRLRIFLRWIRTPWKVSWREAEKIERWRQQQKARRS